MAKIEIQNWDLQEYRDALEKAYWLIHEDMDTVPVESGKQLETLAILKPLSYLNGSISLRVTKYHLYLGKQARAGHDYIGMRMATIELNDDKVPDIIKALDKGALSIGLIDRLDRRSVDLLRQLKKKVEDSQNA